MAYKQNGHEYATKDREIPFWLEDITKLTRRTSLDTTLDLLSKPKMQNTAHSAGTLRHSHNKGYNQNGRWKYRSNKVDWGDSSTASSNDFLSDLLPHYVTPRYRGRMNNTADNDFHDVILGPRLQENTKVRKKLYPKEVSMNLQQNESNKRERNYFKNSSRKPASLGSVTSDKSTKREKPSNDFIIPELPEGRLLELKIYANWGDKYLVGLNGIELFDMNGDIVQIEKVWTDSDTGDNFMLWLVIS